jgi:AcrR family transcriptional regulator
VYDLNKFRALRLSPSQERGRERIRIILDAARKRFREDGVEGVTTNDIADTAGVPIGSVYRYFTNKGEIILAVADHYTEDISGLLQDIAEIPLLPELTWQEIMDAIMESWIGYTRQHGSFAFLYSLRSTPVLGRQSKPNHEQMFDALANVVHRKQPMISNAQILVCLKLTITAVDIGFHGGDEVRHEATRAIAIYLEKADQDYRSDST